MATKWQILQRRRDELAEDLRKAEAELLSLPRTVFGRPCSGCGEILETEMHFAAHYEVPDQRYLNLGYCPKKDRGSRTRS
jgi:hypothetical protein